MIIAGILAWWVFGIVASLWAVLRSKDALNLADVVLSTILGFAWPVIVLAFTGDVVIYRRGDRD